VLVSIGDTIEAISGAWDAAPSLVPLGRPHRDQAPPAPPPSGVYCVFTVIAAAPDRRTNSSQYWRETFQFAVYGRTHAEVTRWMAEIGAVIDPVILQYANASSCQISIDRTSEDVRQDGDRKVAIAVIRYALMRRRPRTDLGRS